MNVLFPNSSFRLHSVSMVNSSPTRQISPVRLQTTVGVPLNDISLSNSWERVQYQFSLALCRRNKHSQPSSAVNIVPQTPRLRPRVAFEVRSVMVAQWPMRGLHVGCRFCQNGCWGHRQITETWKGEPDRGKIGGARSAGRAGGKRPE